MISVVARTSLSLTRWTSSDVIQVARTPAGSLNEMVTGSQGGRPATEKETVRPDTVFSGDTSRNTPSSKTDLLKPVFGAVGVAAASGGCGVGVAVARGNVVGPVVGDGVSVNGVPGVKSGVTGVGIATGLGAGVCVATK